MSTDNILELEISLLLIKYEYKQVIKVLASLQNVKEEDLKQLIQETKEKKATKAAKPKRSQINFGEIIFQITEQYPAKKFRIDQLAVRFENKIFLPELKDVRRFLERKSSKSIFLKSRLGGAKRVFDELGKLTLKELDELIDSDNGKKSDLSILSDQIIGK